MKFYICTDLELSINAYFPDKGITISIGNHARPNDSGYLYDYCLGETGYLKVFSADGEQFSLKLISERGEAIYSSENKASEHLIDITNDLCKTLDIRVYNDFRVKMFQARHKFKRVKESLVWKALHYLAYNVLEEPLSESQSYGLACLINRLREEGIYCGRCQQHYDQFQGNYDKTIHEIASTKENFVNFVLDYHNSVNKSINRQEFTPEQAEYYYQTNQTVFQKELENYGIDLKKLYVDGTVQTVLNLIRNL